MVPVSVFSQVGTKKSCDTISTSLDDVEKHLQSGAPKPTVFVGQPSLEHAGRAVAGSGRTPACRRRGRERAASRGSCKRRRGPPVDDAVSSTRRPIVEQGLQGALATLRQLRFFQSSQEPRAGKRRSAFHGALRSASSVYLRATTEVSGPKASRSHHSAADRIRSRADSPKAPRIGSEAEQNFPKRCRTDPKPSRFPQTPADRIRRRLGTSRARADRLQRRLGESRGVRIGSGGVWGAREACSSVPKARGDFPGRTWIHGARWVQADGGRRQFSTGKPSIRRNSWSLSVTSTQPRWRACAPIIMS